VLTTSRCNLYHSECSQREWRDIDYDITPAEVEHFLDVAKQSGYFIDIMGFGAREPTMNSFLPEIIRIVKKRGVRRVWMLTNGYNIESLEPVKELIDYLLITCYGKINIDAVRKTQRIFGRKAQVDVVTTHHVIKNQPRARNEQINCVCPGLGLFRNKVYVCAPIVNLHMRLPKLAPKKEICTDVSPYFLDRLKTLDKGGTEYCYVCADNLNVSKTLKNISVYTPLGKALSKIK
jgi:hypothetical protein